MHHVFGKERGDDGFTLIELLVVMIIIGILAAIAIPTFLNQRKNGWRSAMTSDLRNASQAAESWSVNQGNGTYAGLTTAGLDVERGTGTTADVTVTVVKAGNQGYCLEAQHSALPGESLYFDSKLASPAKVDCSSEIY